MTLLIDLGYWPILINLKITIWYFVNSRTVCSVVHSSERVFQPEKSESTWYSRKSQLAQWIKTAFKRFIMTDEAGEVWRRGQQKMEGIFLGVLYSKGKSMDLILKVGEALSDIEQKSNILWITVFVCFVTLWNFILGTLWRNFRTGETEGHLTS